MSETITTKVISVSSLAAHKTASLKAHAMVLGSVLLPVPTAVLNGVTSFSRIYKNVIELKQLLAATFELSVSLGQRIILSVGYLNSAAQVQAVEDCILTFQQHIDCVIVDPISGDNGSAYVKPEIIEALPSLFRYANWLMPNITELKFFSGIDPVAATDEHIQAVISRYGIKNMVVTSYQENDTTGIKAYVNNQYFSYLKPTLDIKMDGAGDFFVAYFIKYRFFARNNVEVAIKKAVDKIHSLLNESVRKQVNEIVYFFPFD